MNEGTLHVTIAMLSDWGVGTGTGIAGARHAGIEKAVSSDGRLQPVVRGTVVAGLVGEQARAAARGLDDGAPDGPWQRFAAWLFGSESQARHVVFSDAQVDPHSPDGLVHDVVSSSLDEATGTARQNFLRVFERAAPCVLRGTATLLGAGAPGERASAPDGDPPASSPAVSCWAWRACWSKRSGRTAATATASAQSSSAGTAPRWTAPGAAPRAPCGRPAPSATGRAARRTI